jgi:hypothetical protein
MAEGLHQITPPSAVVLDERKYPVITEDPSWSQICEPQGGSPGGRRRRGAGAAPAAAAAAQRRAAAARAAATAAACGPWPLADPCPPLPSLPPPAVSSIRSEDYKLIGGAAGLGFPVGYIIGGRARGAGAGARGCAAAAGAKDGGVDAAVVLPLHRQQRRAQLLRRMPPTLSPPPSRPRPATTE